MSNFWELINIDDFEKKSNFKDKRWNITFFCKDCWKITEVDRPNKQW